MVRGADGWTRFLRTAAYSFGPGFLPPGASEPIMDGDTAHHAHSDPAVVSKAAYLRVSEDAPCQLLTIHRGWGVENKVLVIVLGRTLHNNTSSPAFHCDPRNWGQKPRWGRGRRRPQVGIPAMSSPGSSSPPTKGPQIAAAGGEG